MITDDELLALIGDATTQTAPPTRLLRSAYASRAWADIDLELAALVEDTAELAGAGVRGDAHRRLLFESSKGVAEIEVNGADKTLVVRCLPASLVRLEYAKDSNDSIMQDDGREATRFVVPYTVAGPARLHVAGPAGSWRTGWFTL